MGLDGRSLGLVELYIKQPSQFLALHRRHSELYILDSLG